jgi:predicted transcriptional regulator of viral defense system
MRITTKTELPLVRFAETTPLYTVEELAERYKARSSRRSVRNVIYGLVAQGRVRAIARGVYAGTLLSSPFNRYALPGKLVPDAVIAFHSALEYAGVANQMFYTVYYLSRRGRKDVNFDQTTFHCVAPPKRLAQSRRGDFQVETRPEGVMVTGRERSFLDCLMRLEYSGGLEELDRCLGMFPSFDFEAGLKYLGILRRPWLYARAGYLLDRHAKSLFFEGKWRDRYLRRIPRGVVYLGRKEAGCRWIPTWNVMVPPALVPVRTEGSA